MGLSSKDLPIGPMIVLGMGLQNNIGSLRMENRLESVFCRPLSLCCVSLTFRMCERGAEQGSARRLISTSRIKRRSHAWINLASIKAPQALTDTLITRVARSLCLSASSVLPWLREEEEHRTCGGGIRRSDLCVLARSTKA